MNPKLVALAELALQQTSSASAVVFLVDPQAGTLGLAAAAGISGAPLDGLVSAVRSPSHPIARTATTGKAEFDVTPMAPGGPALRSHAPLLDGNGRVVGVLALAHQEPLDEAQQAATLDLAHKAAEAIGA